VDSRLREGTYSSDALGDLGEKLDGDRFSWHRALLNSNDVQSVGVNQATSEGGSSTL
jgi:hypothetical protein